MSPKGRFWYRTSRGLWSRNLNLKETSKLVLFAYYLLLNHGNKQLDTTDIPADGSPVNLSLSFNPKETYILATQTKSTTRTGQTILIYW
jgi:hypothetical protein